MIGPEQGSFTGGKASKLTDRIAMAWCIAALLFLVVSQRVQVKRVAMQIAAIASVDSGQPAVTGEGFGPGAVPPQASLPSIQGRLEFYGSYVGGDASTGVIKTQWYRPSPNFYLYVCGYPLHRETSLFIELDRGGGSPRQLRLSFNENPGEYWRLQKISLPDPAGVRRFRLMASDTSQRPTGWLGFSQPFSVAGQSQLEVLKELLMVVFSAVTALVCVLGPGLLLRARLRCEISSVWLPFPGIVLLAALGLLIWESPSSWSATSVARWSLVVLVVCTGFQLLRTPLSHLVSRAELRVLSLVILLIGIATAKVTYSIGPAGELYRGKISRTLETGNRSDSRISFHVVQLVSHRQSGGSKFSKALFSPFDLSHRGPIAGLAAAPLVLASGGRVPEGVPEQPWSVFDPQGFAAYRISMIVFGAAALIVIFGLASDFVNSEWALMAFLAAGTAPFTIHELYFTWPKILAASFVLLCVYLVKQQRFFVAGIALGLGYLCHPSALLWTPAAVLCILLFSWKGQRRRAEVYRWGRAAVSMAGGLAVWLAVWRVANQGHFHQDGFLNYFYGGGVGPSFWAGWLKARGTTALNTLVPSYLFLFHRGDPNLIATDGTRQPWVQFVQQYWCSLAFGSGLVFYFFLLRLHMAASRVERIWLAIVFLPAFAWFLAYFGAPNTGLMREGLHAWFLGWVLFTVILWSRRLRQTQSVWMFATVAFGFRGLETVVMLVPFESWSRGFALQPPFALSDFGALVVMLVGCCCLFVYGVRYCSFMRRSYSDSYVPEEVLRLGIPARDART